MKRKILIPILVIFFVGAVIAVGVLDKNVGVSKEQKTALESVGLSDYIVTDYEIGTEEVERCLFKENAINTCQRFNTFWMDITYDEDGEIISEEKIYYSPKEITDIKDNWEQGRLEGIADATIQRQSIPDKTKVSEGQTIITEKN